MTEIIICNVSKVFSSSGHEVTALQNINCTLPQGSFVCLLGPSGCGKSTLLNAIAGFSPPTSGEITVDGKPVTRPGPDRGMVFQEYALFPWMTVEQNIAFGLEIQKTPKVARHSIVNQWLTRLHLTDFRDRFPKDLSGGMRQRVAIARILALDSPIVLMDEPFGALDALTRSALQDDLLRIWDETSKTIIFVTHSVEELIYLADRIIVMTQRPGRIQCDQPIALPRPRDPASSAFNAIKREINQLILENVT